MTKMVTVQRMPQTITFEGKNYGPSRTPIQIPEPLAVALGLPVTTEQAIQSVQEQNVNKELAAARALAGQYQERYERLQGLLQPHMNPEETPESAVMGLVNFVKDAERIFTPVAGDGGKSESGLETMRRIVDERNALKIEVERLQGIIKKGTAENKQLESQVNDLKTKLSDAETANLEYLEYVGELLPQGFPERQLLMAEGHITIRHVQEATDEELKAIDGIGDKRLEAIRKVAPYTPTSTG